MNTIFMNLKVVKHLILTDSKTFETDFSLVHLIYLIKQMK